MGPIVPLFERARTLVMPLVSAHKVEKKANDICISKEKVKVCGGQSVASFPDMMETKTVQYACVAAPSSKAKNMEQRAKAGESLGIELGVLSTAYTKEEAEPKFCATGGMGMTGGNEFEMHGANGASGMGRSGSGIVVGIQCPDGTRCDNWEKCCQIPHSSRQHSFQCWAKSQACPTRNAPHSANSPSSGSESSYGSW